MADLPDRASSDTARLIDAIRSLDHTMRMHQPSAPKLIRRKTTLQNGINTGPSIDDATASGEEFRSGQVIVEVRIVFLRIGEIDTQKEKYTADVFMHAKWREPKLDGQKHKSADIDWDRQWTPKLYIDNVLGEPKESVWYVLYYDESDRCTVYEKHRLSGSFSEFLELNQFPFDTQDLAITVTSERSVDEIDLVKDEKELCGVNVQSFKDEQEWSLHHDVETWRKTTTKVSQNTKSKHPAFSVACKASRRPGFFIWNIFFVMFFIASLAFTAFSVHVSLTQNRLQLSFILLLTTVTFKFIVNQNLPRISYLTYLDKYILITMSILCSVCAWHAILPIIIGIKDEETARYADKYALIVMGTIFIGFQLIFILWIVIMNRMKRETSGQKEEDHENRQRMLDTITDGSRKDSNQLRANSRITPYAGVMIDSV